MFRGGTIAQKTLIPGFEGSATATFQNSEWVRMIMASRMMSDSPVDDSRMAAGPATCLLARTGGSLVVVSLGVSLSDDERSLVRRLAELDPIVHLQVNTVRRNLRRLVRLADVDFTAWPKACRMDDPDEVLRALAEGNGGSIRMIPREERFQRKASTLFGARSLREMFGAGVSQRTASVHPIHGGEAPSAI